MLQSTLTFSDTPIQKRLCPRAISTKLPHTPVKERHYSTQRYEIHQKLFYSSETVNKSRSSA